MMVGVSAVSAGAVVGSAVKETPGLKQASMLVGASGLALGASGAGLAQTPRGQVGGLIAASLGAGLLIGSQF